MVKIERPWYKNIFLRQDEECHSEDRLVKEIQIQIPSSTEFVGPIVKFFDAMFADKGLERSLVANLVTSVIEAVGNAIVHGNHSDLRKNVNVLIKLNKNVIECKVHDEGHGVDIESLPDPLAPENLLKPCGRGIFLIKTFMDDVRCERNGRGSTLIMQKAFERDLES